MKIKGLDKFKAKLDERDDIDLECLDIALDDTADFMHRKASELVPVDTGHLRANINVKRQKLKKTIGTNVPYAASIEFGKPEGGKAETQALRTTFPLGPKPFLRPAFQLGKPKIKEYYKRCLGVKT